MKGATRRISDAYSKTGGSSGAKILVVYYSETGNTEKVAKAIYDAVSKEHTTLLKRIDEINADRLNDYDLVFVGSPCHGGDLAPPAKTLLKTIPESPKFKLAGFFTHSCPTEDGSPSSFKRWASKCVTSLEGASKEKKIDFKGYYSCKGAPSPPIQEFMRSVVFGSTSGAREEYMREVLKHPDHEDLRKAEEFARNVASDF